MLSIRLSRVGKKKYPLYRLIVLEKSKDPWGDHLEILGSYNPHTKATTLKEDRIKYWLSQGAQPSPTAFNLLVDKELIKAEKVRASKSLPGKKKQAENEAKKAEAAAVEAAAAKASEEARAKEAEAAQAAEAAPAESAKEETKEAA